MHLFPVHPIHPIMTTEYLQHRLSQWQTSRDMDALMRAADSLDLLTATEHRAWTVDEARAAGLAQAIQSAIASKR